MLDQVQGHRHVGEEVAARVGHVGPDAAHLGGEMEHDVGLEVGVHPRHVGLAGEVVVTTPRDRDLVDAAGGQRGPDAPAEEAGPAGHDDARADKR